MTTTPNSEQFRVLGISGSLRKGSFNTALLRAAQELAPLGTDLRIFDLTEVPLYNGDVEAAGDPESVTALKEAIREADALLFATPEYNRGPSGVLKNAIDWASRDRGPGSLAGKPVTMIGAGGMVGTARAQEQLLPILSETGALVMVEPGVQVSLFPVRKFDADGRLVDEATRGLLRAHLGAFERWIDAHALRAAA